MQRNVFKLQKRIYQASCRGDLRTVRALQRLLMHSWSAKLLAVRRITQDNQGKKTAGVDGVKSLTPTQRLTLAQTLTLGDKAAPGRWVSPPYPIAPSKRWPTVCSNPNGKHALHPTATASDRAGPVTMRSKLFSRSSAIKPNTFWMPTSKNASTGLIMQPYSKRSTRAHASAAK